MVRAGAIERKARVSIQGPFGKAWSASISRASPQPWRATQEDARQCEANPAFASVVSRFVDGNAMIGAQRVQRSPVTSPFLFRVPAMRSSLAISTSAPVVVQRQSHRPSAGQLYNRSGGVQTLLRSAASVAIAL